MGPALVPAGDITLCNKVCTYKNNTNLMHTRIVIFKYEVNPVTWIMGGLHFFGTLYSTVLNWFSSTETLKINMILSSAGTRPRKLTRALGKSSDQNSSPYQVLRPL